MRVRIITSLILLVVVAAIAGKAADEGNLRSISEKVMLVSTTPESIATEPTTITGDLEVRCPATVVVGVLNLPAGWTDFGKRVVPFENLKITNNDKGSQVTCDYDSGRYAVDRAVPGRFCSRPTQNSPAVSCRAIPTKK
jgi:hypothetical protein